MDLKGISPIIGVIIQCSRLNINPRIALGVKKPPAQFLSK